MTGQDAVSTARAFNDALGVTGIVMTRMDGDARGGAALSMRFITGAPIKLTGSGEKLDALEPFHPERVAGRILGMGDIVSLVEKASETIDREDAERLAAKMAKGKFDLEDYASQLRQITKMGSLSGIMGMLPGHGEDQGPAGRRQPRQYGSQTSGGHHRLDDGEGAARSDIIKASRKKRIASGSGVTVQEVNQLLKQFDQMTTMMKRMSKMGQKGMMRGGLASLMGQMGGPGSGGGGRPGGPGGRRPF